LSILERGANARTLYGIVVIITVAMMLIIGSGSLPMALSKSSSHQNNKSSLSVPILPSGGIPGNSGLSNLTGVHNQFSSTSLYSAPPPSASTLDGNISNGVSSSKKVVMIGFDDGWKSQITYAKPILDKYGLKASFFVVCNYVNSGDIRRMNW